MFQLEYFQLEFHKDRLIVAMEGVWLRRLFTKRIFLYLGISPADQLQKRN